MKNSFNSFWTPPLFSPSFGLMPRSLPLLLFSSFCALILSSSFFIAAVHRNNKKDWEINVSFIRPELCWLIQVRVFTKTNCSCTVPSVRQLLWKEASWLVFLSLCMCQYLFACLLDKYVSMRMYVLLPVSTGLWCSGTGEVQLPSVHYTLGGNAIRGQGLGICSESIERNIKHKKDGII